MVWGTWQRRHLIASAMAALLLVLQIGVATAAAGGPWWGRVGGVTDGDTLMVLRKQRWPVRLHLLGIDAPELSQPYGKQAREFILKAVYGKQVRVAQKGTDHAGRVLALIFIGDKCLNEQLLEAGLAWRAQKNKSPAYAALQKKARLAKRGLWVDNDPVPPWDWTPSKSKSEGLGIAPPAKGKRAGAEGLDDALNTLSGKQPRQTVRGGPPKRPPTADRACRRHSDCVFRFRPPCHCAPCGWAWREASNRKSHQRAQRHWAAKKPRCKPCPLCPQPTTWLGKRTLCIKRQCTVR